MQQQQKGKAMQLWEAYRDTSAIKRAECYAEYTLPYLMVDPLLKSENQTSTALEKDYQSVGALLVNNLASKIAGALFPVGIPYFRLQPSPELLRLAKEQDVDQATLKSSLVRLAQEASGQVFFSGGMHKLTYMIKLLIVTGMCLVYRDSVKYQFSVWNLHSFVVRRDAYGDVRDAVLKQRVLYEDLPAPVRAVLGAKSPRKYTEGMWLDYYTHIAYKEGELNRLVEVYDEVDGHVCGEINTFPEHLSPWKVLDWNVIIGENYARGHVEDYAGDFARLSTTSEALGIYEQESLDVLNIVDESAGASVSDYQSANTGDYIPGKKDSVTAHEKGDYQKIAAVNASISGIEQRLGQAFMYVGQMRNAERVTAEEVRTLAREVENTFGGVYSLLAHNMQTPFAYISMYEVRNMQEGILAGLITRSYRPTIQTGTAALQRTSEIAGLVNAAQEIGAIVPVLAQASSRIDPMKLVDKILLSNNVDLESISKSAEQIKAEAEQKAAQANAVAAASDTLISNAPGVQEALQGVQ